MNSIRRTLTRRLLAGTFVLLLLASIVLGVVMHAGIVNEFDRGLEFKLHALATLTDREERMLDIDFDSDYMPEYEAEDSDPPTGGQASPPAAKEDDDDDDEEEDEDDDEELPRQYFQFTLENGTVVRKSESLGAHTLPLSIEDDDEVVFANIRLPDGRRGRSAQFTFLPREDEEEPDPNEVITEEDLEDMFELAAGIDESTIRLNLHVARGRGDLDLLLAFLYTTLGGMGLLLLGGISLLVRSSIREGLKPIDEINTQITGIGPDLLDGRVELSNPPQELFPILKALNALLDRLQEAFQRERRFSSNVAHELRTPVAELKSACEIGAKWPEDVESNKQFFEDITDIADQMDLIVNNMLSITRCENGTAVVETADTALQPMIESCWRRNAELAKEHQLELRNQVDPALTVSSDHNKLTMIVQNLIDNAISHSTPGGVVHCFTENGNRDLSLVVENPSANLNPDDLKHVFERFWQKDPTASGNGHAGLGMSIVQSLSDLLNIRVNISADEDRVFRVRLSFPS